MSPTAATTSELTQAAVKELAAQQGPCITITLPDSHPGAQEGSRAVLLREMTRSAAEQVSARKLDAAGLLQPIDDFASAPEGDKGGPGIALFRSPGSFAVFTVHGLAEASVSVGRHFNLAPLIKLVSVPQEFYILGLSRKNPRLYRYTHGHCDPVALPTQVPANMDAALGFDQPEHRQDSRSASGNSTGAMHAVQFGSSTERETAAERLHRFFQLVDRGLQDVFPGTPLLLAGVHEEIAAYRRAAHNKHLFTTDVEGSIDFLTPAEIAARAAEAALAHYRHQGEDIIEKVREMPDRRRTRSAIRSIVSAATTGRVHQLCVAEGAKFEGSIKGEHGVAQEDFINAAIVETLRAGGEVFMLPAAAMPAKTPMAAILRF